jgi:plastocyanin
MTRIGPVAAVLAVLVLGLVAARPAEGGAVRNVRVGDNYFAPTAITVARGTTVRWRWVGRRPHNVTATGFASRTQTSGIYSRRFNRRGARRVYCTLHAGMEMRVRVR